MTEKLIMETLKAGRSVKWPVTKDCQRCIDLMDKLEAEGFVTITDHGEGDQFHRKAVMKGKKSGR